MRQPTKRPRVLVVTPEVTFVPRGMGPGWRSISARAGGLGDMCAAQIHALFDADVDVHLAMPNYRNVFKFNAQRMPGIDWYKGKREFPEGRLHLAQDRSFYYHPKLFLSTAWENIRMALAFQREVINRIIPEVRPDLIHCYDWMTGLIPAMSRYLGIPSIFSLYRLDSPQLPLSTIEECGIDAAAFWKHCFYTRMPIDYEETRNTNPVDMLATGVFAAHFVTTFSSTFLNALIAGRGGNASPMLRTELLNKRHAGTLSAIAPAPDPSFNPATDHALMRTYDPDSHVAGKPHNKLSLQKAMGLAMDSSAPVCFWPTRLDGSRPGWRLLADSLPLMLERYRHFRLQVVAVAEGDCQGQLRALIDRLQAWDRVAVCDYDARRYRLAYAGSDFVLMPLCLDPCGLPCRIGQIYGALPIGFDGSAIHDCVEHLDVAANRGSGFLFENFDTTGFLWAMDQAMNFYAQPRERRAAQISRIMTESLSRFDSAESARQIVALYGRALGRPFVEYDTSYEYDEMSQVAA